MGSHEVFANRHGGSHEMFANQARTKRWVLTDSPAGDSANLPKGGWVAASALQEVWGSRSKPQAPDLVALPSSYPQDRPTAFRTPDQEHGVLNA
jgi:hypothetical protein